MFDKYTVLLSNIKEDMLRVIKASPCHLVIGLSRCHYASLSFALRAVICASRVINCHWSMVVLLWGFLVVPPILLVVPPVETHGRASLPVARSISAFFIRGDLNGANCNSPLHLHIYYGFALSFIY